MRKRFLANHGEVTRVELTTGSWGEKLFPQHMLQHMQSGKVCKDGENDAIYTIL